MDDRPAINLTGNDLTYKDVVSLGIGDKRVELDEMAIEKCKLSRQFLEDAINEKKIIYGVNTSFGPMCNKIINDKEIETPSKQSDYQSCSRIRGTPFTLYCHWRSSGPVKHACKRILWRENQAFRINEGYDQS